ncbi:MAG: hypothetical protein Q4C04_05335 [Clostridia bacterium]|nr:hypothetical protein [Clostridia bacterium]
MIKAGQAYRIVGRTDNDYISGYTIEREITELERRQGMQSSTVVLRDDNVEQIVNAEDMTDGGVQACELG